MHAGIRVRVRRPELPREQHACCQSCRSAEQRSPPPAGIDPAWGPGNRRSGPDQGVYPAMRP
ncbi:hypothetical protein ASZ90_011175 [hydrocarbon metagenome]|uniref:Uncharacterized protein n=1 Tax=hydrocarbon metagenome TaxID=938273 RepID=A0A0W8FDX7_9ZZZZ